MNKLMIRTMRLFITLFLFSIPFYASAHQPRVNDSNLVTEVADPEISKAYYGELSGQPHTYIVDSTKEFELYVGILVPAIPGAEKDVLAEVYKGEDLLASVGGVNVEWKEFFEPFGQSRYWDGGEYKSQVEPGRYTVVVSSTNNDSKYSLAIGDIEAFDGKEGLNAIKLIPELKRDFFEESPASFIKSPFGWGYVVIIYVLAFAVGYISRLIIKKVFRGSSRGAPKNIGSLDRFIRVFICLSLFFYAITSSWNPLVLFISGFALFEAIFSWCIVYVVIGRNSNQIKNN